MSTGARSHTLFAGILPVSGIIHAVFQIAGDKTCIVKGITLANRTGSPNSMSVLHLDSAGSTLAVLEDTGPTIDGAFNGGQVYGVLESGDWVACFTGEGPAGAYFGVYGALLDAD